MAPRSRRTAKKKAAPRARRSDDAEAGDQPEDGEPQSGAVRSIAGAVVTFGLVSVPVKIYPTAESRNRISFHLLHASCGTRLRQQYFCPTDKVVVGREDMVRGYEFAKGEYVVFSPDELKALDEATTGAIDVAEFVPLAEVDRIYLDRAYYLGPDKGGDRGYRLLAEALEQTGKAAVGQYAARGQQYLVLVRPMHGVLVMEQLHYVDELRSATKVPVGKAAPKPAELALAKQFVEHASTDEFDPEKYHDTVRDRVVEAIEQKVEGKEVTLEPAHPGPTRVIDLMQALKRSLEAGSGKPERDGKASAHQERDGGRRHRRRAS